MAAAWECYLEGKGLVYKRAGEKDRRSFLVFITEKGRSLIQETTPIEHGIIDEMKQCMTEEEYDTLLELLLRISSYVSERTGKE